MKLQILCPQWGHEHLELEAFLEKVKDAGYDGIDTWVPAQKSERQKLIQLLDDFDLLMVSHQHQAIGNSITEFCKSFEHFLYLSAETNPLLINSHSGRDYLSLDDHCLIIDAAENFSVKNNIQVIHETHRGRMLYSPQQAQQIFSLRPDVKITADLSHWVCVTESYLENFESIVNETINRTAHVHARVGFTEGPQIPDPRWNAYQESVNHFMKWWQQIIDHHKRIGSSVLTITCEFGPPPYMACDENNYPIASQWDINLYMKDLIKNSFETTLD